MMNGTNTMLGLIGLLLQPISSFTKKTAMSQVIVRIFGAALHYTAPRNGSNGVDGANPRSRLARPLHTLDLAFLDLLFSLSSCISKCSAVKVLLT
jgi:hypothetical protein